MIFKRDYFVKLLGPNLTKQVFQNGVKEISDSELYDLFVAREVDGSIIAEMLVQVAGYSNTPAICDTFMTFYDISSLQDLCSLLDDPSRRCPLPIPKKIKQAYNALRKALSNKEDDGILGWVFSDLMYEFKVHQDALMKKLIKKLVQALDK